MWAAIQSLLALFGFGAKIAAKNQEIINSPEVVRGKEAKQDQQEKDSIHESEGDIERIRRDMSE